MEYIVVAIFSLMVTAVLASLIGKQRNRPGFGFLLGLLLGPFGVIAAGLFTKRYNHTCPMCGEGIVMVWDAENGGYKSLPKCPHCCSELDIHLTEREFNSPGMPEEEF